MKPINNEKGTVLVVALIIMGLLAVIGTAIMMTTSIELKIAQNERESKTAFYRAENGRVIAAMVSEAAAWGIDFVDGSNFEDVPDIKVMDGDFIMEAFDIDNSADQVTGDPDVRVEEDGFLSAEVDVDKLSTALLPGSSAEFAAGYEGAGASAGVMTILRMDSIGSEPTGARASIRVQYMLIPR
ncbi:MAG: pilus assembly PilX N-terminal domain-containing protein [Deltaproteobacteria bacterium]|nr:pilus assembly PilX N-terminal domain-containing protein [Deltaproteobacteria bacterium]